MKRRTSKTESGLVVVEDVSRFRQGPFYGSVGMRKRYRPEHRSPKASGAHAGQATRQKRLRRRRRTLGKQTRKQQARRP